MSARQSPTRLSAKEQTLFKAVVRFYETKQLKKALKSADTILKRCPDHGETLAMKGLTLNALDKKTEATDLVRRGLQKDMRSHICWHVYGLLYRSERDYREAAKAYLVALRIDKDNQQILRDLALLQIQIRDYDGLEHTRRTLLTVKPNQRNNWIGFALSFHLLGNYATAVSVLDTYRDTLKQSSEPEDRYELSELLLYRNSILEESGDYAAALSNLDEVASKVVDRLALRETRARLLLALGKYEQAAAELRSLLAVNPDNQIYHKGLHACAISLASHPPDPSLNGHLAHENGGDAAALRVEPSCFGSKKVADLQKRILGPISAVRTDEDVKHALKVCDELTTEYPGSQTAQRIALDILPSGTHPQFVPRVDAYVRRFLRKGIPSLFSDVKLLYANPSKAEAFGCLFENYRLSLECEDISSFPPLKRMPSEENDTQKTSELNSDEPKAEPSSVLLWVLHFLAQHYDRLGRREIALQTIEAAIKQAPETVECYLVKARILKHIGNLKLAVEVADEARNLDLADRYLNTKCSKYALRAGMVKEAEAWVGLFTRDADSGGVQALYDMQCMWFELGAAESHFREGQLALALKKFTAVDRHFADMVEDQFDFHSYCLRKVTLRAYVSLLRFEDRIHGHPYYGRAARGLVRCLLRLYDLPERERVLITGDHFEIQGFASMTDAERKKAVSKRKKQLARKKQVQQGGSSGKGSVKPMANGGEKSNSHGGDASGKSTSGAEAANKSKSNPGWMEVDPSGADLVKGFFEKDAKINPILSEASNIVRELQRHSGDQMQTHMLSFELAVRKKRYLQALRAVNQAKRLDDDHPTALLITTKLSYELDQDGARDSFSAAVKSVYDYQGSLTEDKPLSQYLEDYRTANKFHAERRIGVARCRLWLAKKGLGAVEKSCRDICVAVEESDKEGIGANALSAAFCRDLVDELRQEGLKSELVDAVASSCRSVFPQATCF